MTISLPAGAVGEDTSVSLTDNGPRTKFSLVRGSQTVFSVSARPEGQHFPVPVTITFAWPDADNDGVIDGTTRPEGKLALKRNIQRFSKDGFGVGPFLCENHLAGSGCAAAAAFCGDPAGTLKSAVANCCDPVANTWTFQTCDFSEFVLSLQEDDLIPSRGTTKSNCVAEWAVDNPFNEPSVDRKELPNFKQTCTEGDAKCERAPLAMPNAHSKLQCAST